MTTIVRSRKRLASERAFATSRSKNPSPGSSGGSTSARGGGLVGCEDITWVSIYYRSKFVPGAVTPPLRDCAGEITAGRHYRIERLLSVRNADERAGRNLAGATRQCSGTNLEDQSPCPHRSRSARIARR